MYRSDLKSASGKEYVGTSTLHASKWLEWETRAGECKHNQRYLKNYRTSNYISMSARQTWINWSYSSKRNMKFLLKLSYFISYDIILIVKKFKIKLWNVILNKRSVISMAKLLCFHFTYMFSLAIQQVCHTL